MDTVYSKGSCQLPHRFCSVVHTNFNKISKKMHAQMFTFDFYGKRAIYKHCFRLHSLKFANVVDNNLILLTSDTLSR